MDATETTVHDTEAAVETRVAALEKGLTAARKDFNQLIWLLGFMAVGAGIWAAASSTWSPATPAPTNRDTSLEALLSSGVHCYDSTEERAAARQRALAAIDRMTWQEKWDTDHADPLPNGFGNPPPAPLPSITDSPPAGKSWDAAKCFEISTSRF